MKKKVSEKNKEVNQEVPILFFNTEEEDKEAYLSLMESGIHCELRAPAEEPTPLLLVGFQRFTGLAEIKKFITERKSQ